MSGQEMIILQIICVLITILAIKGDKSESAPLAVFFSLFPLIGYLIAGISLITIVARIWQSKGKCSLGHNYVLEYDSEAQKWKNGRMPMRVSVGGYETYCCTKCKGTVTHSWSAF